LLRRARRRFCVSCPQAGGRKREGIVVYNAQHENLVKSWVDGFTKETGIKVTA
jgi:iron(III) transport system substrate-binding protein